MRELDVVHMPINDPADSLWEPLLDERPMLRFLQCDYELGLIKVSRGARTRVTFSFWYDLFCAESVKCERGHGAYIFGRPPLSQPPRESTPVQPRILRVEIEKFFCVPASVIVASAKEENATRHE